MENHLIRQGGVYNLVDHIDQQSPDTSRSIIEGIPRSTGKGDPPETKETPLDGSKGNLTASGNNDS